MLVIPGVVGRCWIPPESASDLRKRARVVVGRRRLKGTSTENLADYLRTMPRSRQIPLHAGCSRHTVEGNYLQSCHAVLWLERQARSSPLERCSADAWRVAGHHDGSGLVLETRQIPWTEVGLVRVHDLEPYLAGRRAYLRQDVAKPDRSVPNEDQLSGSHCEEVGSFVHGHGVAQVPRAVRNRAWCRIVMSRWVGTVSNSAAISRSVSARWLARIWTFTAGNPEWATGLSLQV